MAEEKTYNLFLGGAWTEASSGKTYDSLDPSSGERVARVAWAGPEDARRAVEAARRAFDAGVWSALRPEKRADVLRAVGKTLRKRLAELAELEARDSGSVIKKAMADVGMAANTFLYYANLTLLPAVESIPPERDPILAQSLALREPIGVCAQIIPWNFPLVMAAWKIAPALAAGNAVVLKPAPETPCTALELAGILGACGVPPGVVNVVTGDAEVGETLVGHPDVDKVAFTGSTEVGRRIMALAAPTVKRLTLELGGKSPVVVLEDADLDLAADGALFGIFFHQGQVCTAGSRLLLPESLHDRFVDRLVQRGREIVVGPPLDYNSALGPLVSERQMNRVLGYIQQGRTAGARLALGGARLEGEGFHRGWFVAPTVFDDVPPQAAIAQEEIFGPVLSVFRYKDLDEAVALANGTPFGLAASVWSRNLPEAIEVARRIRAGTVWINEHHLQSLTAPFGGYKQSGFGRELGLQGLLEYAQTKHLWIDLVGDRSRKPWYDAVVPRKE